MYLKSLEFTFSFIGLSETWLRNETCELYCLDGYEHVEQHRTYKSGCGVGLFVHHTIPFTQRNDLSYLDELIECVTIEIEKQVFNTTENVIISVIYRPPNTDTRLFTENINIVLNIIKRENKICYFMGDYNINILNYDSHSATAQFVDLLYSYALLPLINRPTRISQSSATLIDNIFTNNIDTIDKDRQGILVTDITDHFPVFYINSCHKQIRSNELHICRRNFCYDNKLAFQRAITETDWSEMYLQCDNVQCAFSLFHSKFVDLFERHFPKRKIKLTYNNRKPWLTTALKQSIRTKNRLYKRYKCIKSTYNECWYKSYRNKLTSLLKNAEKSYYAELLESNKSNLKKTWSILKNIVNKSRVNKMQEKFKITDNTITTDKSAIVEHFNDFFVNIGHNLAKRIPDVGIFPKKYLGDRVLQTIFLEPVTPEELSKIFQKKWRPWRWWCFIPAIKRDKLEQGVFPDELELANVLPLFKFHAFQ